VEHSTATIEDHLHDLRWWASKWIRIHRRAQCPEALLGRSVPPRSVQWASSAETDVSFRTGRPEWAKAMIDPLLAD